MLRRKEDMKDWQKDSAEVIKGVVAPDWSPVADDAPDVPNDFVPEVKKTTTKKKPKKKVTEPIEGISVKE